MLTIFKGFAVSEICIQILFHMIHDLQIYISLTAVKQLPQCLVILLVSEFTLLNEEAGSLWSRLCLHFLTKLTSALLKL